MNRLQATSYRAPRPAASLRSRCGTVAPGLVFNPGAVSYTDTAADALARLGLSPIDLVRRHCMADWSDMLPHDRQHNLDALRANSRIVSSFRLNDALRIWVITEGDRSSTSVLLPGEF